MKIFITAVLTVFTFVLNAQADTAKASFKEQWVADSDGLNGYRLTHVKFDEMQQTELVNGKNILKMTPDQIREMLGAPNSITSVTGSTQLIYEYRLSTGPYGGGGFLDITFENGVATRSNYAGRQ